MTDKPTPTDAVALARYKVVPAHESMFHRFAVVAGDGKQQLYLGREVECENMARKFAGAFLDGAFYQANITPSTQAADSVQEDAAQQPRLKVRVTAFPESNGKQNWTALLVRADKWDGLVGNCGGISLARGEMWNRVAYEAECARFLIGERDTEPFILDYGDDIKTPEEWKGEVYGGRKPRGAARKQGEKQ